ncbi:MAG: molybdopterin molybdotransferase MoeA, partial [Acidimicrobiia bacterium]|nr:molybdopterin molybdotransferase MoeA [Acidimicrobiia bacterium]
MRPLTEARLEVLGAMPQLPPEIVSVEEGLHRVTSEPVVSSHAVPPFDNSAMDGFAVRAANVATAPAELEVIEDVPAGSVPSRPVGPGQATRIMTGAPMPSGADTVVKVEDTLSVDENIVEVTVATSPGTALRPAGGDLAAGQVIVEAGVRLTARHLASIATARGTLAVARRPVVAVMSTGDEVVPPATARLKPGTIRDANRVLLRSLLTDFGAGVVDLGIVGDDLEDLRSAYAHAAAEADVVVSTGGVSMGDYDFVKQVLGEQGSVQFWRVAMQPAKPFAFGEIDGVPLFGLPGNPVSTFVAYEQFLRPALLTMMGARYVLRPRIRGTMGEDLDTSPEKEVFVRVILAEDDGRFVALSSGGQSSNVLSALASAEAFAVVPVGVGSVAAG